MTLVQQVTTPTLPLARFEPVIGEGRYDRLISAGARLMVQLGDRVIWNINSTAVGGGVAEMLQVLVGYVADAGIAIRWNTITGDQEFFGITKRLHNQLHGAGGNSGQLGPADAHHYEEILAANAAELLTQVTRGDVAILHDPQTAGLTEALAKAGVKVVWRCHIGIDEQNDVSRAAWEFLRPYLAAAHAFVFTRRQFAPLWVPRARTWVIPPSIDPFSPKNAELDAGEVRAILAVTGVADDARAGDKAQFPHSDGTSGQVTRPAMVTGDGRPGPGDRVVVQVSRWDKLKDMAGVMEGFATHVLPEPRAYLMLVGPSVSEVADDPEGGMVFAECRARWHQLPREARQRIMLVTLPLDDVDENAAMVNAIQRRANVIVQKSLAEGFGLTVAEGMWKGRPLIGSAVGGIVDQIADGTGYLLQDPRDLAAFGADVRRLLADAGVAERMGAAGKAYTREHFVGDVHLLRFGEVIESLLSD
ncbi:MAG TPA: glycosyltransferase [Streptosporangiaceae bacterium]|nr:glycosyltransferase [Streptosporangiaceae bacterium]